MASDTVTSIARALAGMIALVALASLVAQGLDLIRGEGVGPPRAVWIMLRYFTVLTNTLVALTFGAIATGLARPRTLWLAQLTLSIGLVAAGYHLLLRGLRELSTLGLWADFGMHTLVPAAVWLWWVVFAPKSQLRLGHVPGLATWPFLYTAYALTRGGIERVFPYPFLDPLAIGWTAVLRNIAEFGLILLVAGAAMVGAARLLSR